MHPSEFWAQWSFVICTWRVYFVSNIDEFFFNEFPRIVPFRYIILIFYPILMHFKLRALIVSLLVSCISYSFRDKVNRNRPTKAKFQNLNFLIFHPILMHFLQNDHLDGLLMEHFYFISNRGLKGTQILKLCIFWRYMVYMEFFFINFSFVGRGNRSTWRKPPTCRNTLTNFNT